MNQASLKDAFMARVAKNNPNQPEYLQAVTEVISSIWPFVEKNPQYIDAGILDRLVEPERLIQFRVSWLMTRVK